MCYAIAKSMMVDFRSIIDQGIVMLADLDADREAVFGYDWYGLIKLN